MSQEFVIEAFPRDDQGRGASRRLRRENGVPAIVYGGKAGSNDRKPQSITLKANELARALEEEAFYSSIITLTVGDKSEQVILKDLQRHPAKDLIWHADFLRVTKSTKIKAHVPLHFINEDTAPAIKLHGGVANHQINEVEVICLPQNLPEFIEVDMTTVEMDQVVHLSDLKLPKDVKIAALLQGEDHDLPVVAIHKPRGAKVDDEAEDGEEGEESGEDKE